MDVVTLVNNARVTDGNEGPMTMDHTPDWITIRGSAPAGFNHGVFFYGWDYLASPFGGSFV